MLDAVRIVLVRPQEAGNVGAVARVMRNFGLSHLVLVAPSLTRPAEGYKWAKGAEAILEGADTATDLAEALHGAEVAWATTRRRGKARGQYLDVGEAAVESVQRARTGSTSAWVFGPESRGLSTDEIALCTHRVTLPTADAQPSLNLAQAVAVCAYETARATQTGDTRALPRSAAWEERDRMYRQWETGLLAVSAAEASTVRTRLRHLREILERARLSSKDVRFLRGIARQMVWAGTSVKADPTQTPSSDPPGKVE